MKIRKDFVTNSSSSSFIIQNNSDEDMSAEEIIQSLLAKVLEDARDRCIVVPAHDSITLECGDHLDDDGAFETFIHDEAGSSWGCWSPEYGDGRVEISMLESHH